MRIGFSVAKPSRAGSESKCFVGDPLAAFPVSHSIKVIESDETLRHALFTAGPSPHDP
jgi:hypothetical protein